VGEVALLLQCALEERGWSQAALCRATGLSTKHVNLLVQGKVPMSPTVAVRVERALPGLLTAEELMYAEVRRQVRAARIQTPVD
jgi:plasmid maintenance system antidote protein VapI